MDLSQITSTVQLISGIIISATTALVALGAFIKPIRVWVVEKFGTKNTLKEIMERQAMFEKEQASMKADQALMKAGEIATLRNQLTEIYYKVEAMGYVPEIDRINFTSMYEVYTALGGNNYVHELYNKILEMPSVPPRKTRRRRTTK